MRVFKELVVVEDTFGIRVAYTPEEYTERYPTDELPEGYLATWYESL